MTGCAGHYFFDPVFHFENGSVLEIFSSTIAEISWTFQFTDVHFLLESNENFGFLPN